VTIEEEQQIEIARVLQAFEAVEENPEFFWRHPL
jgi:hypothetical protein